MLAGYMRDSAAVGCAPERAKDPADRTIIATAIVHDALLASIDSVFPAYPEIIGRLIAR